MAMGNPVQKCTLAVGPLGNLAGASGTSGDQFQAQRGPAHLSQSSEASECLGVKLKSSIYKFSHATHAFVLIMIAEINQEG